MTLLPSCGYATKEVKELPDIPAIQVGKVFTLRERSLTMQFAELLLKRRSVRKYIDKPVTIDVLKDVIDESILAPSAGNEQPWKYMVVY